MNTISTIPIFLKRLVMSFADTEAVHYINGPSTLPPPLSLEEEKQLISELCDGSKEAKEQLIERNLRLVVYIAKKFENTGICVEDLISIGTIGLIKGINSFRPDKGTRLATYASRCIENAIHSLRLLQGRKLPLLNT